MSEILPPIEVRRLGRVEYSDGLAMQERIAEAVRHGEARDSFLMLEHNPVLTLGRGASLKAHEGAGGMSPNVLFPPEYLHARGIEIHETGRGGDVTYHGPGQIVGYPILNLARSRETKDVRKYVCAVEDLMIRTCADFGIRAERVPGLTGVWVGQNKIGAIGVRVSHWVTSHGFALNVSTDLSCFDLIVPCGIPDRGVTSISRETGRDVRMEDVEDRLEVHAAEVFGRDITRRDVSQTTVAVVIRRGAEYLCLKRIPSRGGFWQIVTGRMEPGETPRVAAARELSEETGVFAPVSSLNYEHAFLLNLPGPPLHNREICFLAEFPARTETRMAPEEHDEHRWLPLDEAIALVHHAGHKRALRLAAIP